MSGTASVGSGGAGGTSAGASAGGAAGSMAGADNTPVVCPTTAPFPDNTPASCTRAVLVAGGQAIRRVVSFDAKAWVNQVQDPQDGQHQDEHAISSIAIGKGVIVATGDGGVLVSTDATTWTRVQSLPAQLHASQVVYALGQFELVGGGTWTSPDGTNWSGALGDAMVPGSNVKGYFVGHVHGVAASSDRAVFVGDDSSVRIFDGTTWQDSSVGNYHGWLDSIAFGNGRFVTTGDACCGAALPTSEGLRSWSTDGATWHDVVTNASPGAQQIRFGGLIWAGSRFLATGSGKNGFVSPDGVTWSAATLDTSIGSACSYDEGYLGAAGTSLYTSTDALHWQVSLQGQGGDWPLAALAAGRILKP